MDDRLLERASVSVTGSDGGLVQLLYPLELSCDEDRNKEAAVTLNPDAPVMLQQLKNSK